MSDNILDLIFTDTPGFVPSGADCPVGTSDHSFVPDTIKNVQAVAEVSFSRKIYIKSPKDWNGILNNLSIFNWHCMYRQDDCIASLYLALVEVDKLYHHQL